MKPVKDIEQSIRKLTVESSDRIHDGILQKLLKKLDQSKRQAAVEQAKFWRAIMKSGVVKLIAAGVIIISVVSALHFFGSPIENVTWADVEQAFSSQSWVHIKYDNGRERWDNLHEGKAYFKNEIGTFVVIDYALNVRHDFVYGEDHITAYTLSEDGKARPWPLTAWELIVGPLEKADGKQLGKYHEAEKHADTLDDRQLIRFDIYFFDALGQRILIREVWADPTTHLPFRIREKLSAGDQRGQKREYITGDFDFPKTGPDTIYDLGVPANLKIVNHDEYEATTSIEARKVIQAGKEASENFPSHYCATFLEDKVRYGAVHVIYRSGQRISVSTYYNRPVLENSQILLSDDNVLEWTQTQEPAIVRTFDGERFYTWERTDTQPEVHVNRANWPHIGLQNWFHLQYRFWPYVGWARGRRSEIISDHPETPTGSIALLEGDSYFFVDPEKDYLCVGEISMRSKDGISSKSIEKHWSDFSQLPSGHWYPTKEHLQSFADPERGTSSHERFWNIDIKLLEDSEYPPDVFNGKKLLEGAKVKTY